MSRGAVQDPAPPPPTLPPPTPVPPPADVGELSRCHCSSLRKIHHRFPRGGNGIDDALQDLWLALLRTPPPIAVVEHPARLHAWLHGAIRRRLLDAHRREIRRRQVEWVDRPDTVLAPEALLEQCEVCEQVRDVLADMNAGRLKRAAGLLELRYLDGQSLAQIGERLGLTASEVSCRLRRAEKKFRAAWCARMGQGQTSEGRVSATCRGMVRNPKMRN